MLVFILKIYVKSHHHFETSYRVQLVYYGIQFKLTQQHYQIRRSSFSSLRLTKVRKGYTDWGTYLAFLNSGYGHHCIIILNPKVTINHCIPESTLNRVRSTV